MKKNNEKTSDHIRDRWENLGIAFAINESRVHDVDPERAILDSLKEFQNDRKLLGLILMWLKEFGNLLHIERIKSLLVDLSATEIAWLGGLADSQVNLDHRWKVIFDLALKKLGKPIPKFQTSNLDELQAKKVGIDKNFEKFGLIIPQMISADPKKLQARTNTIKHNLWLRMRLLFGTNWRADIATAILLDMADTSYQAEKILGCSRETAYRNWNALKEANIKQLLKNVA